MSLVRVLDIVRTIEKHLHPATLSHFDVIQWRSGFSRGRWLLVRKARKRNACRASAYAVADLIRGFGISLLVNEWMSILRDAFAMMTGGIRCTTWIRSRHMSNHVTTDCLSDVWPR